MRALVIALTIASTLGAGHAGFGIEDDTEAMVAPRNLADAAWSRTVKAGGSKRAPACETSDVTYLGLGAYTRAGKPLAEQSYNRKTQNIEWRPTKGRVIFTGEEFRNRTAKAVKVAVFC